MHKTAVNFIRSQFTSFQLLEDEEDKDQIFNNDNQQDANIKGKVNATIKCVTNRIKDASSSLQQGINS